MTYLETVFANYFDTKHTLGGKATYKGTPDQVSLRQQLPEFFGAVLKKLGRLDEFKIAGSFGNGNIADIPWVAIFNKSITTSAQDGYYIVLLFAENMEHCYLSLNQGVTKFEKLYTAKLALQKIKETADGALSYFTPHPEAILGEIDLATAGHLGKGYELGAIESFFYQRANLPDEATLTEHFKNLLAHYDNLALVAGKNLQSLAPVSEAQYQQTVLDKAKPKGKVTNTLLEEPAGGIEIPRQGQSKGKHKYVRNPTIATAALTKASFKCEIDKNHQTFISSARDLPYVEAHHLIPMSQQHQYSFSLDVTANIFSLCPMCHKLLHHAKPKEKKTYLLQLLQLRKELLQEKGITITPEALLEYYNKDLLENDA